MTTSTHACAQGTRRLFAAADLKGKFMEIDLLQKSEKKAKRMKLFSSEIFQLLFKVHLAVHCTQSIV